jgi:hypothetical protein
MSGIFICLPRTGHKGPEGERYSCTLYVTVTLHGGAWLTPCPCRFTPGKETQYPLCRRLDGHQGQSGWVWKTSPPLGFDPPTVKLIASCYTDSTIPAPVQENSPVYLHVSPHGRSQFCISFCMFSFIWSSFYNYSIMVVIHILSYLIVSSLQVILALEALPNLKATPLWTS